MAEELMSEALVFMGSVDDPRDIGNRDPAVFGQIDDANDGMQGCERVGSGLGVGGGDGTQEGGFSGIGITDEPDVCDGAELEEKPALFTGVAFGMLAGNPVGGTFEVDVSLAAVAAFAEPKLLAMFGQVRNGFLLDRFARLLPGPVDDRAYGNPHEGGPAASAVLSFAESVSAAARADERLEKECDKIVGIVVGLQNDVAAVAAVAAIRPAVRDKFFAAETAASVPTITGLGVNANLVNKSHDPGRVLENRGRVE